MGAQAKFNTDGTAGDDRDLVENIARAMQNRPLMRRLANVEAAFNGAPEPASPQPDAPALNTSALDAMAESLNGTPTSTDDDPLAAIQRRVEEAEAGWTMPPSSAEWLGKAQRERTRARMHNAGAWLATLAIGGAIIATTALMLQP